MLRSCSANTTWTWRSRSPTGSPYSIRAVSSPKALRRRSGRTRGSARFISARCTERAMLEIHDIDTYYGDSHILHAMSLLVGHAEVVAVLGRNGVGKTTLI